MPPKNFNDDHGPEETPLPTAQPQADEPRCPLRLDHLWGTEMHNLVDTQRTTREDGPAISSQILSSQDQAGHDAFEVCILKGDVVKSGCDAASLIPLYEAERGYNAADDPLADLAAMRSSLFDGDKASLPPSNREEVLAAPIQIPPLPRKSSKKRKADDDTVNPQTTKQKVPALLRLPRTAPELKWVDKTGALIAGVHDWCLHGALGRITDPTASVINDNHSVPVGANDLGEGTSQRVATPPADEDVVKKKRQHRGGFGQKGNVGREETMELRTLQRGNAAVSSSFSLIHDASAASTGWQGRKPPPIARARIDHLYRLEPDAAALYPYIKHFFPVHFKPGTSTEPERGTFILDKNGIIFAYRSWRAAWLADMIADLEEAQKILVGKDLRSASIRAACAGSSRGPHLPIILGHQRQSSVEPYLTAWHRKNHARVALFLELPVIKKIIGWVAAVFRAVWPGLAARFELDAAHHLKEHGIKPLFGYFWNFCWNASFPGQARIHTGPHADCKNQVGVCMILVYVLKHGVNFNHKYRSWIVLWEAELAIEMPPWVLTGYPSALFYHFNIDIHRFQFVYTLPNVDKPTPENSWPIVAGDEAGRGSMVFFSQSTMRHGPATGFDSLKQAVEAGQSGVTDFGEDIKAAFDRAAVRTVVPAELLHAPESDHPASV